MTLRDEPTLSGAISVQQPRQFMAALRLVAKMEWRRLRSIRSSFVLLGLALISSLTALVAAQALKVLNSQNAAPVSSHDAWTGVLTAPVPATWVIVGIVGAMAVGHDFRYGTLHLILLNFPQRSVVLLGKALVVAGFAATASIMAVLLGAFWVFVFGGWPRLGIGGASASSIGSLLTRIVVSAIIYACLGLAVCCVTGSLQLGIAVPLVWANVVEPIISVAGPFQRGAMAYVLPFRDARNAVLGNLNDPGSTGSFTPSPWVSLATFAAWGTAAGILATWRYNRIQA